MDITVDASAIIAVIVNETSKPAIISATYQADLVAPSSIYWEIGNAFSAMLKRKRLTVDKAIKAIEIYNQIPIRFVTVELTESIQLAAKLNIYAYDAYLIRCAQKYKTPLLSLDKQLLNAARTLDVDVIEVS